jgi:hypothetical protein
MSFLNFFAKSNRIIVLTLFVISSFVFSKNIFADYMQSTTYKMESDSLNFGGVDSSSPSYSLIDTLGEVGTGDLNSTNYGIHAGFLQSEGSYIAVSGPPDLSMSSMSGLFGGSSEDTASWLVTTNNTAGYTMSIASSTTPTLESTKDSFPDYTPAGANPDYNFINASDNSSFGFSPEGTEASTRFKNDGSACNTGNFESTGKCWDGLSTTPKVVAGGTTSNIPDGSTATIRFRAESGVDHIQISGQYNATITATFITL